MWTEKYRPRTLNDIVNQVEIVNRLKSFAKMKGMPHCLFAGPPGTGKTTAALCLAYDLFGERYMDLIMELNASDERGIDVVREKVKTFARTRTLREIPFKILILDEADNMTSDAQQALRRTMERFTETCRFILVCNYSGKIIEPIQSRCAPFRFTPLSNDDLESRLRFIAGKEKATVTDDGVKAILELCEGDMRRMINTLQAAAALGKKVDEKIVYAVAGRAHPLEVQEMLKFALQGKFVEAREKLRSMLIEYGLSGIDIVKQIHQEILGLNLPEPLKPQLADIVGEVDFRLSQGADEEVQLSALLARLALVGEQIKSRK